MGTPVTKGDTESGLQRTGWAPGLLQDDCRELSRWFAGKLDARRLVRESGERIQSMKTDPPWKAVACPTCKARPGEHCTRLSPGVWGYRLAKEKHAARVRLAAEGVAKR